MIYKLIYFVFDLSEVCKGVFSKIYALGYPGAKPGYVGHTLVNALLIVGYSRVYNIDRILPLLEAWSCILTILCGASSASNA